MRVAFRTPAASCRFTPPSLQGLHNLHLGLHSQSVNLEVTSSWQPQVRCPLNHVGCREIACSASSVAPSFESGFKHESTSAEAKTESWDIRLLYDSHCPLCMREVAMLKSRDDGHGRIDFVDITSPTYDPAEYQGITYTEAMARLHGILPDGTVVTSVEVLRRCYEAVGLGWLLAATKFPPFGSIANAAYELWAKNRLRITGRPDLADVLDESQSAGPGITCDSEDVCEIPFPPSNK